MDNDGLIILTLNYKQETSNSVKNLSLLKHTIENIYLMSS